MRAGLQGPVVILVNVESGAASRLGPAAARRQIAAAAARHGIEAEIALLRGAELQRALRDRLAATMPVAAVVAAGGDGTVSTLAQELAGSGIALGVLPLGTLNHFARDLGLPLELDAAVAVIAGGRTVAVDVGEVNGLVFVDNSSIGLYPEMVRERDRQRRKGRRHRLLAMAVALLHVLRRPPVRRLRIEVEGRVQAARVPFAFIGNNLYGTEFLALGRRETLQGGMLCLFMASPRGIFGIARLLLRAAFGRLDQTADFERRVLPALTIHSRRRRLHVSHDGEVAVLHPPLRYRIRPGALRVLVPPAAETTV